MEAMLLGVAFAADKPFRDIVVRYVHPDGGFSLVEIVRKADF